RSGFIPRATRGLVATQNVDNIGIQSTRSGAVFGQGTYHLTDDTGLTVGLRYTRDWRRIFGETIAVPPNPNTGLPAGVTGRTILLPHDQTHRQFNKLTWRFALEHKFTDDVFSYLSYNRGFKSG